MRTQTNLNKRNGVWYFRKKVDADIRADYPTQSIRKSLGRDLSAADAKREAARLAAHYDAEFDAFRQARQPAPKRPLKPALIPQLAQALHGHILTADEEMRTHGMDGDAFERWEQETEATAAEMRKAYARGDSSPIDAALSDWLGALGIEVERQSADFLTLRREFLKARLKALEAKQARNRGELVETPAAPSVASLTAPAAPSVPVAARKGAPRLRDVVDYWKGIGEKSHRTVGTADLMVKEFTALHGDLPLSAITKAHFVEFRDQQLARVKPATVQARFNLLKAAFTVCLQDDKLGITSNPLQYVKIR